MELSSLLTIIGIISPFILATVWMTTLITKISNRALLLELAKQDHESRIDELEKVTSYASLEKVVEKVCRHVFNSKEFKDSMKDSIKETMLHIDRNRSHAELGAIELVLDEVKRLHADITKSHHNQ